MVDVNSLRELEKALEDYQETQETLNAFVGVAQRILGDEWLSLLPDMIENDNTLVPNDKKVLKDKANHAIHYYGALAAWEEAYSYLNNAQVATLDLLRERLPVLEYWLNLFGQEGKDLVQKVRALAQQKAQEKTDAEEQQVEALQQSLSENPAPIAQTEVAQRESMQTMQSTDLAQDAKLPEDSQIIDVPQAQTSAQAEQDEAPEIAQIVEPSISSEVQEQEDEQTQVFEAEQEAGQASSEAEAVPESEVAEEVVAQTAEAQTITPVMAEEVAEVETVEAPVAQDDTVNTVVGGASEVAESVAKPETVEPEAIENGTQAEVVAPEQVENVEGPEVVEPEVAKNVAQAEAVEEVAQTEVVEPTPALVEAAEETQQVLQTEDAFSTEPVPALVEGGLETQSAPEELVVRQMPEPDINRDTYPDLSLEELVDEGSAGALNAAPAQIMEAPQNATETTYGFSQNWDIASYQRQKRLYDDANNWLNAWCIRMDEMDKTSYPHYGFIVDITYDLKEKIQNVLENQLLDELVDREIEGGKEALERLAQALDKELDGLPDDLKLSTKDKMELDARALLGELDTSNKKENIGPAADGFVLMDDPYAVSTEQIISDFEATEKNAQNEIDKLNVIEDNPKKS